MICLVCGREIDKHLRAQIERCLKKGFGVGYEGVSELIASTKLVVEQSQESSDKRYFKLRLKDGTIMETYDLRETFAVLMITREYQPQPEENDDVVVLPELPTKGQADPENVEPAEGFGVG